jgi:uncharacterized protein YhbP (UPF0306 family)
MRVLSATSLCSIATIAPGNRAHINTVFFAVSRHLELYFLSDPESLHSRNLESNPSMAMTVFDSHQRWDAPGRGVQLFGTARRTRGEQARRAAAVYGGTFPPFARWVRGRTAADRRRAALLRSYTLYRFLPTRVKILDEAEFGGATFVIATIRRARSRRARSAAEFTWQASETRSPSWPADRERTEWERGKRPAKDLRCAASIGKPNGLDRIRTGDLRHVKAMS